MTFAIYRAMTLADLTIIYLACGSPFAVHFLLQENNRTFWSIAINVAVRFLLWPLAALLTLRSWVTARAPKSILSSDGVLSPIRNEMELIVRAAATATSVFELRNTFDRYTGLFSVDLETPATQARAELFDVSGHTNPALASTLLQRSVVSKLSGHRDRSRVEFMELVTQLAAECCSERIFFLAIETAEQVGDLQTAGRLRSMIGHAVKNAATDQAGELWNPGQQSHSTAN